MERRHVIFRGRVQGVGFRATARQIAAGFSITGWVRNEPDGSVLLEAQGNSAELDRYLEAVSGHMGRLIVAVNAATAALIESERGFEVRR